MWATPQTADGNAVSWNYGLGIGTYRGGTVQQRYVTSGGLDGALSADTRRGAGSDALLVLLTNTAAASTRILRST